jgi:ABC-type sugar transport system substrate-binding protein
MIRHARQRNRRLACGLAMVLLMATAACGGDDSGSAGGKTTDGDPSTSATGPKASGTIVAFIPTTTQNYVGGWARGAKKEADRIGLQLQLIENNFDQNEQDSQVRQHLGSGSKPLAYIWWPTNAPAARASLQALHQTGVPVVQTNQGPAEGTKDLLAAYAGVDDAGNGKVTGENAVAARDAMKKAGIKLHSAGGNLIIVGLATGYQAGIVRNAEVTKAAQAAGMKVVDTIDAGFDAAAGYEKGSQLITRAKGKGIDIVVSLIDNLTAGVVRALEEQGFKPGKDVYVVAGTCSAGLPFLRDSREYASGIQPAENEGALAVSTGLEASKGKVAEFSRFMPNQSITLENVDTFKLDGKSVTELCAQ